MYSLFIFLTLAPGFKLFELMTCKAPEWQPTTRNSRFYAEIEVKPPVIAKHVIVSTLIESSSFIFGNEGFDEGTIRDQYFR
jgi:hypothetical protein